MLDLRSVACLLLSPTVALAQDGLPDGPTWGRAGGGRFQPKAANVLFATGDGCALCHSASARAGALWSATGEDVSPHGLWQGTMMANAARDPYWRAQVAKEGARHPDRRVEIEATCVRCHAPMGHHTHRIAGWEPLAVAEAAAHPLYSDGVSCTVCHQVQPDGLGTDATFDGHPLIKPGRMIFGPYEDPAFQPMRMHAAFTPTQGAHIRESALCASCHTLRTGHTGTRFPEQTPYYEWRNSVYSTEASGGDATTANASAARSCAECHMPEVGDMRIARNPMGVDFNIRTRPGVRGHQFVGGNAFMLDLLRANAQELGVTAPGAALERAARATRAQLSHATATITIDDIRRVKSDDGSARLEVRVTVTNLTGHKFPTGYPSRRAWVSLEVRDGGTPIFHSGAVDDRGRLVGVENELDLPHREVIDDASHVLVYELIAADPAGNPTTHLADMAVRRKDNRLLPRGYRSDGPHAADTAPVAIGEDPNFIGGSDRVTYRVRIPPGEGGAPTDAKLTVVARVLYQTIPPAWVDPLRTVDAEEAARFVRLYDAADAEPEQVAVAVGFEP